MAANPTLIRAASEGGRYILGGLFAYAAIVKLCDPAGFVSDIGHYRLFPFPLGNMLGIYLPWLELTGAVALLLRWREKAATVLLFGLCLAFALVLAITWARGINLQCGCFGHGGLSTGVPGALARALGLAALAFFRLRLGDTPWNMPVS